MIKKNIAGQTVEISKKAKVKRITLRVQPPEGRITVTAPKYISNKRIEVFIKQNLSEIEVAKAEIINNFSPYRLNYISGETVYLWGKSYILEIKNSRQKYSLKLENARIIFTAPETATTENKEKAFNNFYRQQLREHIPDVAERIERTIGIPANEYRIKNMKTKWGTCNTKKKRIWLNLQLAKKPIQCLELVITHELVHLLEKNHSQKFYELLGTYYPNWKEVDKILNELPIANNK